MWEIWSSPKEHFNCYIGPGLLPTSGILVICGEPGIGKSFLAQQTAFELACGRRWMGLFPAKETIVVYLELEKRSPIARARFRREDWQKEYPEALVNLGYYDEDIPQLDTDFGANKLENMIKDTGAKIIIVDSFTTTILDETDTVNIKTAVVNYRKLAKTYEVSFILIQHLIKRPTTYDQKGGKWKEPPLRLNDMKGSKYLQYEVDTVLGVAISKGREREIGFLKHSFCPYQLSEAGPLYFQYRPDTTTPFLFSNDKVKDLLFYVGNGITELSDLENALGMTRPTITQLIYKLRDMGLVKKITGGGRGIGTQIKLVEI